MEIVRDDKDLFINVSKFPELRLDYDDVNTHEVDEMAKLIVKALKAIPKEEIKAAQERIRALNEADRAD